MAIYSGFTHEKWWFSIAMLNYQSRSQSLDRQNHHSIFVIRRVFFSCFTHPSSAMVETPCHMSDCCTFLKCIPYIMGTMGTLFMVGWTWDPNIQTPRAQNELKLLKPQFHPVPHSSQIWWRINRSNMCLSDFQKIPWLIITSPLSLSNWPLFLVVNPRLWYKLISVSHGIPMRFPWFLPWYLLPLMTIPMFHGQILIVGWWKITAMENPNGRPGRPCAEAAMEAQGSTYRGAEPAMVAELDVSDVGHRYVLLWVFDSFGVPNIMLILFLTVRMLLCFDVARWRWQSVQLTEKVSQTIPKAHPAAPAYQIKWVLNWVSGLHISFISQTPPGIEPLKATRMMHSTTPNHSPCGTDDRSICFTVNWHMQFASTTFVHGNLHLKPINVPSFLEHINQLLPTCGRHIDTESWSTSGKILHGIYLSATSRFFRDIFSVEFSQSATVFFLVSEP